MWLSEHLPPDLMLIIGTDFQDRPGSSLLMSLVIVEPLFRIPSLIKEIFH